MALHAGLDRASPSSWSACRCAMACGARHRSPCAAAWRHRLATAVHVALYVLLLVLPVMLGWLALCQGKAIPFFALQLPP